MLMGIPHQRSENYLLLVGFCAAREIDELPQLFSVLLGDMSLIGPRPLLPEDQPSNVSVRLSVRPGITGWAQINGGKLVTPEEKGRLDDWYVQNASLSLDLRIILMTVWFLLKGRMSSKEASADTIQAQTKNRDLRPSVSASSVMPPKSEDFRTNHAPSQSSVKSVRLAQDNAGSQLIRAIKSPGG